MHAALTTDENRSNQPPSCDTPTEHPPRDQEQSLPKTPPVNKTDPVRENEWIAVTSNQMALKCIHTQKDQKKPLYMKKIGVIQVNEIIGLPKRVYFTKTALTLLPSAPTPPKNKHEEKKQKKSPTHIAFDTPSLPMLMQMKLAKSEHFISHEAIAQILFYSIDSSLAVVDDGYRSAVVAALATARGGTHNLFGIKRTVYTTHLLDVMGYPTNIEEYSPERTQKIPIRPNERVVLILAPNAPFCPEETLSLIETVHKTASVDFLMYHHCKDALVPLFNALMKRAQVSLINLRETFMRRYQTRIGLVHPEASKTGSSGFILTGTFFNP